MGANVLENLRYILNRQAGGARRCVGACRARYPLSNTRRARGLTPGFRCSSCLFEGDRGGTPPGAQRYDDVYAGFSSTDRPPQIHAEALGIDSLGFQHGLWQHKIPNRQQCDSCKSQREAMRVEHAEVRMQDPFCVGPCAWRRESGIRNPNRVRNTQNIENACSEPKASKAKCIRNYMQVTHTSCECTAKLRKSQPSTSEGTP